jgi:hypothetical protein
MIRMLAGALVGGLAVWYWREDLQRYAVRRERDARERAADAIQTVQDKADAVIDSTKDRIGATLQAGQDAIRPRAF